MANWLSQKSVFACRCPTGRSSSLSTLSVILSQTFSKIVSGACCSLRSRAASRWRGYEVRITLVWGLVIYQAAKHLIRITKNSSTKYTKRKQKRKDRIKKRRKNRIKKREKIEKKKRRKRLEEVYAYFYSRQPQHSFQKKGKKTLIVIYLCNEKVFPTRYLSALHVVSLRPEYH